MIMFVKSTKSKGYEYLKIVESYRDEDGVTRHKVLFNLGRSDQLKEDKSFCRCIGTLVEILDIPGYEKRSDLMSACSEAEMLNYGYLAYKKIWKQLHIEECLKNIQDKSCIKYNLSDVTELMAVQHLLRPRSKKATFEHHETYYNSDEISLQHLYRALDRLAENKEFIESFLFGENYLKVNRSVDIVFYDVTTFAFQSINTDEIRNFGFSKDCKFHEVQTVMGLIIDADGMPIGYELFPGNTFDGKTMVNALDNIKKRFGIRKVIIVADRGLNNKDNLFQIKNAGYGYIVASRIKNMSSAVTEQILNAEGYIIISETFRYKTLNYTNTFKDKDKVLHNLEENLIVSYSETRAAKDRSDRQRLVDKAEKLLSKPEIIGAGIKRGGRQYIKSKKKQEKEYVLDTAAIEKSRRFDGYYGIQTSEKLMSAKDVTDAYHSLWRIEESFRIMKSTLEVRPVFHWTPTRIKGHFVMCFLSLMLERKLELLLKSDETVNSDDSPDKIREALNLMQFAKVSVNDNTLYIKAKNNALGNTVFKIVGLKLPKNVSSAEDLSEYSQFHEVPLWGQLSLF